MKYFLDTEFIEGFKKPISWLPTVGNFNKAYHSIQLISIGIVCEDGREYYAVSSEFEARGASEWVMENVIQNIKMEWIESYCGDGRNKILDRIEGVGRYGAIKVMQREIGKSNRQIAKEIEAFCRVTVVTEKNIDVLAPMFPSQPNYCAPEITTYSPEFYAYYADYDWVLFCSLFGTMMDLPKGFPMYCVDLKQTLDDYVTKWRNERIASATKDIAFAGLEVYLKSVKNHPNYPKQTNEHNSLADAKWSFELYKFLKAL